MVSPAAEATRVGKTMTVTRGTPVAVVNGATGLK